MAPLLSFLPILQTALGVIGSFSGSAKLAKTTGYIQEAVGVVTALTPLVTQFGSGKDITPDDVRAALAGKDAALAAFDAEIAAKGG